MNCCPECFGDRSLRKEILRLSNQTGRCSYCSSEDVAILPPRLLADYFVNLIGAYVRDAGGKLLIQWFREDWGMFDHPSMDDARKKVLLGEILDDREIVQQSFAPLTYSDADRLGEWEKLRDELMYRNRFFPESDLDLSRLREFLPSLTLDSDEVRTSWYRARIQTGDTPFDVADMGAPPRRTASFGRANPVGIPYLYLGSTLETAVSEIRPHKGEIACVAEFTTPSNLKLVDLRNPRKMVSPFQLLLVRDAADIVRMRSDLPFLERLGEELTRPVLPQAAAIDYTPSQYLCEFIKKCGYDGVIYQSSVSAGINLALFDPTIAEPGAVAQYKVTGVSIDVEPT